LVNEASVCCTPSISSSMPAIRSHWAFAMDTIMAGDVPFAVLTRTSAI
jgi:hypothetical protein